MEEKTWENTENLVSEVFKDNQKQMKRWFLAFIITLAALVGTNAYWIYVLTAMSMLRKTETDTTITTQKLKEMLIMGQRIKKKKNKKSRGTKRKRG